MSSRNNHNNLGHSQKPLDKKDSRDPAKKISPISNQNLGYKNDPPRPAAAKSSKKNTLNIEDMSYSNT